MTEFEPWSWKIKFLLSKIRGHQQTSETWANRKNTNYKYSDRKALALDHYKTIIFHPRLHKMYFLGLQMVQHNAQNFITHFKRQILSSEQRGHWRTWKRHLKRGLCTNLSRRRPRGRRTSSPSCRTKEDIGGHGLQFGGQLRAKDCVQAQSSLTREEDKDAGAEDIQRTLGFLGARKRTKKGPERTSRAQCHGP